MEKDLAILGKGDVGRVFPVIPGLDINRQLVTAVDLRQAGQPGAHVVGVHGVPRFDQVVLVVQSRPGADDAHLPGNDVVNLGQLVKAGAAQERPAFGDVGVWVFQQVGRHIVGGIAAHRAEFQDVEMGFVQPHPPLFEKYRPG